MSSVDRSDLVGEQTLDRAHFEALSLVAEHLVPAAHGMPSARDVITAERLQFVMDARPDLYAPLVEALRPELGADPEARLQFLTAEEPMHHMALQLVIVGAYYTDRTVRELLRYPGQLAKPVNAHDYPEYIAEGLIDAVLARGPIWRDPATTQEQP